MPLLASFGALSARAYGFSSRTSAPPIVIPPGTTLPVVWDTLLNTDFQTYSLDAKTVTVPVNSLTLRRLARIPSNIVPVKAYFEIQVIGSGVNTDCHVGFFHSNQMPDTGGSIGDSASGWGLWLRGNTPCTFMTNNAGVAAIEPYIDGQIIGLAINQTLGQMWWAVDGVWCLGGDPSTALDPTFSVGFGGVFQVGATPTRGNPLTGSAVDVKWATNLTYPVPTGFTPG